MSAANPVALAIVVIGLVPIGLVAMLGARNRRPASRAPRPAGRSRQDHAPVPDPVVHPSQPAPTPTVPQDSKPQERHLYVERRAHPRWPTVSQAFVRRGDELTQTRTFAVDVSEGGLLLAGPADLRVGEAVAFSVQLEVGALPLRGHAVVVCETMEGYKGMRIESLVKASDGPADESDVAVASGWM